MSRAMGYRRNEGWALLFLSRCHLEQGQPERQLLDQALAVFDAQGSRPGAAVTLLDLANLERLAGHDLAQAEELAEQCERMLREVQHRMDLGKLLCVQGHLAVADGPSMARSRLEEVQALVRELGVLPASELARWSAKLHRAVEAFEAGAHDRLFRGMLIDDIPEGLRRWLRETGQLRDQTASQPSASESNGTELATDGTLLEAARRPCHER